MCCWIVACSKAKGDESDAKNRHFGFDPQSIDAVVLSHAHIDHSGLLPRLVKEGFLGLIVTTPATRDLCAIMLEDSAYIQQSDHEREVRYAPEGRSVHAALYGPEDVPRTLAAFHAVPYGNPFEVVPGVRITFTDAGHILGSAVVNIEADDGQRKRRILFSGDVGRYTDRLLPEPAPAPQADVVILRKHIWGPRSSAGEGGRGGIAAPCAAHLRGEEGQAHHSRVQCGQDPGGAVHTECVEQ